MEYAKFGEGFVKRENADAEWQECAMDDVPQEELDKMEKVARRHPTVNEETGEVTEGERDESDNVPFARIIRPGEEGYIEP